jgi:tRNA pseudouridine55 synthase
MQDGLVLLDKPSGQTSFQALGPLKKSLGTGKVGHAGTLDRFATGLLVVLTGKLTRLIRVFSGSEKRYTARVRFGEETQTLDPEGEVTATGRVPEEDEISSVLPRFTGALDQVPPQYSAVHVSGRRAHELARGGRTATLEARPVEVFSLDLVGFDAPYADLVITCGGGTYVRSLARDLAYELGTVAHVTELRRTGIGDFGVDESIRPCDFKATRDLRPARELADRVPGVREARISEAVLRRVATGGPLSEGDVETASDEDGVIVLLSPEGRVVAAVERTGPRFKYVFVSAENR